MRTLTDGPWSCHAPRDTLRHGQARWIERRFARPQTPLLISTRSSRTTCARRGSCVDGLKRILPTDWSPSSARDRASETSPPWSATGREVAAARSPCTKSVSSPWRLTSPSCGSSSRRRATIARFGEYDRSLDHLYILLLGPRRSTPTALRPPPETRHSEPDARRGELRADHRRDPARGKTQLQGAAQGRPSSSSSTSTATASTGPSPTSANSSNMPTKSASEGSLPRRPGTQISSHATSDPAKIRRTRPNPTSRAKQPRRLRRERPRRARRRTRGATEDRNLVAPDYQRGPTSNGSSNGSSNERGDTRRFLPTPTDTDNRQTPRSTALSGINRYAPEEGWSNTQRLHSTLDYTTSTEWEEHHRPAHQLEQAA